MFLWKGPLLYFLEVTDSLSRKFHTCLQKSLHLISVSLRSSDSLGVHVAQIRNFCSKISSNVGIDSVIVINVLVYKDGLIRLSSFLCCVCVCVLRIISTCRIVPLPILEHFSFILVHFIFIQVSFYVKFLHLCS